MDCSYGMNSSLKLLVNILKLVYKKETQSTCDTKFMLNTHSESITFFLLIKRKNLTFSNSSRILNVMDLNKYKFFVPESPCN